MADNKKVLLLYFSGTGTTAYVADELGSAFGELGLSVEFMELKRNLIRESRLEKSYFDKFDLIGIGCPTYSFRAPRLLTRILKHLDINGKMIFLYLSCGGMPGNTFWNMYKILKRKKNCILDVFPVYSTNNLRSWRPGITSSNYYLPGDGITYDISEDCDLLAEKILRKTNRMDSTSESAENKLCIKIRPNPFWSLYSIFFTYGWQMRTVLGNKYVIREKCSRCALCATTMCPADAISIGSEGYPVFNENLCIGCQGCVSVCPNLAIESKKSAGKVPYILYREYKLNKLPLRKR